MNRYYPSIILTALVASPFVIMQPVSAQTQAWYLPTRSSVVLIQNTAGARQGTGFIVNGQNGTYYVLTANHVVGDKDKGSLQIRTDEGEIRPIENAWSLSGVDLAILQFTSNNNQSVANNLARETSSIDTPTRIFVLGYPSTGRGIPEMSGGNVTSRQQSSLGVNGIFHNADTRGGMSGSPVLTENGQVIGIHIGLTSQTGFGEAIPIEKYRELAPQIFTQAARDNLALGNYDQAIASLEQVRSLFGADNPEASLIRAYAYFGKRELDRARDEVRQISSTNAEAALLVGATHYLQRNTTSAITNLNTVISVDRRNLGGYALAILGLIYADNIATRPEANINVSNATQLLSNDSFVYLASSCVKIKVSGDTTGATADLDNANRLSQQKPDNPFFAVLSPRLQEEVRRCIPPELGTLQPNPIQGGRYKSSSPTQLGEESTMLAVSRDSRFVAAGLLDGTVAIYEIQTRNRIVSLNQIASFSTGQGRDNISSIAFNPNGKDIAIAASNGAVKVFDIQTRQEKYDLRDAGRRPLLVFSNNGNALFIGSGSGTLRMVDTRNNSIRFSEPNTHRDGITSLTLSPGGNLLATGGGDGTIKLWSTSDLTPIDRGYQAHQSSVVSLAFSSDGNQIISIGDKAVKSCNWQNNSCNEVARSPDTLGSLAVASNGHIAFSEVSFLIRPQNPIFLRDLRSGQSLGNLLGHRDRITALAYTPDSRYLVSSSNDKTLIIWEVQ